MRTEAIGVEVHSAASSGSCSVDATREGRARVAGHVPSTARLVVVVGGARQIWLARQSNNGEVDGVATKAVCVFARNSVDLCH
ncbi:hypothetical protein DEO72_LG11g1067 [Vigna unguiculata]|uniref:Uncharacterized protein n=1 Tax=Vigna unguiculata TaxID=3917 RepID=A0A4D6NNE6_VIGUN|nr:hypothetical protein DEO72_LG11g1067 [Vigna unguiculata]